MKKSTGARAVSVVAGASVLLAGCAPAAQRVEIVSASKQALAGKELPASETVDGVTYANGIRVELTVREDVPVTPVANVTGQFRFDQNVLTPNDAIFNLFGTAVTGVCASPVEEAGELDPQTWYINVGGNVKKSYTATLAELAEQSSESRVLKCSCANNPAGGSIIMNADVTGVKLADIIELAGIEEGANVLTVTSDDGYAQPMPLSYALEQDALLVYQINGENMPAELGAGPQLWMPSSVAKYFTRRVVDIRVTKEDEVPALLTGQASEGEYVNRPNIGIVNYAGDEIFPVGGAITFEGYADDYDKAVVAVEFSLDGGKTWATYRTRGADSEKWVYWYFTYTPRAAGTYELSVRAVTENGTVSPLSSILRFTVA